MSRITERTNVTLRSEAVATTTTIRWNPVDNSGVVIFTVQRMEYVDGEFSRMVPENDIAIPITELMERTVSVTGEDGAVVDVPVQLVVGTIKALFDEEYLRNSVSPPQDAA